MRTQLPSQKRVHRPPQFLAHVYCGQTAGWIKMPLGMEVGLGPDHIVLDGDPAPLPQKGAQPPSFGPCLLWLNGWMDQDGTSYGGRSRPRPHCARWAPGSHQKGAEPQFSAHVCCGQTAGWIKIPLGTEVGLGPGHIELHGDPAPPKRGTAPNFRPMSFVAKRLDGWRRHLVRK